MVATPVLGNEVIFSTDPLAEIPRVTALADDTFVLAWETATGSLFARHLDATGNFTGGNFLQGVSSSGVFNHVPLTTPLVVQESSGAIMTDFGVVLTPTNEDIALHPVDANFTDTNFPILLPESSTANEALVDAVPTLHGTAVAYETQDRAGNFHTFIRWYGPDGTPSQPDVQIGNPGDPGTQEFAALTPTGVDTVEVVFTHFDPATNQFDIRLQSVTPEGINSNAVGVSGAGNSASFPDIAKLADGSTLIVWQDNLGLVMKRLLPSGVADGFGRIRDSAEGLLPKVTALQDGSFLVAWAAGVGTESDGSPNEDIFVRHFVVTPTSPGSSDHTIADIGSTIHIAEPGDQGFGQMSMTTLADGRVVLAYSSETGDATNVNNLVYRIIDPRDPTLNGTPNADTIVAQPTGSTINGLGGNDTLIGQGGADTINGGDGDDTIDGGLGNDKLDGGAGSNTVQFASATAPVIADLSKGTAVGQGTDTLTNLENVTGSSGNDTITGDSGNNVIDGGAGIDTVRFNGVSAAVTVDLAKGTATGQGTDTLKNIENITGSNLADTIAGDGGNNIIDGGMGDDHLDGGAGIDTAEFLSGTAGVTADLTKGTATGQGTDALLNFENLVGSSLNDTLVGNDGNNTLDGRGGVDTLQGLGGNDTYVVDNAADVIKETANAGTDKVLTGTSYTLGAGQSIETFETTSSANAAPINLTGNELSQAITGNVGPNFINGGGGNDTLTGLGGADTFVFNTALSATANVDKITDFDPSVDMIRLDRSIFTALANTGALSDNAFFVGSAAHDADDRIIYDQSAGTLTYDSNGNAAGGATVFATVASGLTLHATNFVVG
jgi:Ca2+-binding RTX toxin-like protein